MNNKRIAIVGGGICGLSLAIALHRKGIQAKVFESVPEMKFLGAGLALAGNAIQAFDSIGLKEDVLKAGKILKILNIKDQQGKVLSSTDAEEVSRKLGVVNNFAVHRADLHKVLLQHLPKDLFVLDKEVKDFLNHDQGVLLSFSDGTQYDADYVIACDGIRSVFRRKLISSSTPRYAGYTCWRGVIDQIPAGINEYETSETWGNGKRFGIVPLTHNRLYWFATINASQNNEQLKRYRAEDLLREFSDFHAPIPQILKHTKNDQLIWSDINDIAPVKKYSFGRILLMGDAAHPTTPNLGQGACMAIEDAAVLAILLDKFEDTAEAFKVFEEKRMKRITKIVNDSWSIGKVAQWQNPVLTKLRNAAIRLTPQSLAERQIMFLNDITFS